MTNRELDWSIAGKITGFKFFSGIGGVTNIQNPDGSFGFEVPHYSTDLNEAFRVIEKMKDKCDHISVFPANGKEWGCAFGKDYREQWVEYDESPARAICLCALKVVEEMEK